MVNRVKSFEGLECWKKAAALRRKASKLAKTLPADERFRMADQLIRCSRSAASQIAEGYGRYHYQEYVQYCRQARGSVYELLDHLITCAEEEYVTQSELNEWRTEIDACLVTLNGFINYLLRAKQSSRDVEEPEEFYEGGNPINN
jgi:four helix bundle protein